MDKVGRGLPAEQKSPRFVIAVKLGEYKFFFFSTFSCYKSTFEIVNLFKVMPCS